MKKLAAIWLCAAFVCGYSAFSAAAQPGWGIENPGEEKPAAPPPAPAGPNRFRSIRSIHTILAFRGRPQVLITSGEHLGAVLNSAFDYVKYLDILHDERNEFGTRDRRILRRIDPHLDVPGRGVPRVEA